MKEKQLKIVISGGGTGGHIFPAVSIANAIKKKRPNAEILFIGAEDRMEMDRVPKAGYPIIGLPITGFNRQQIWKNIAVLFKISKSLSKARTILKEFRPSIAIGVGGFASGPTLKVAEWLGIPTLLQEQNSYAGVTNKLLAKKANCICVAYENMDKFFPAENILLTGNPVRQELLEKKYSKEQGRESFSLDKNKPTVLILGGSLGAQSINEAFLNSLEEIRESDYQFIWQTGALYIERIKDAVKSNQPTNLCIVDFISDMALAYAAADLVISRAGAGSISEFCLLKKPVLLIPSPNVAEDHQTKNALALVDKGAALYIKDREVEAKLMTTINAAIKDKELLSSLSKQIETLGRPNSADIIADKVLAIVEENKQSDK